MESSGGSEHTAIKDSWTLIRFNRSGSVSRPAIAPQKEILFTGRPACHRPDANL